MVREKTVNVYAFVIMPNHFHLSVLLLRDDVVLQKIRYIHRNPIQPTWQLSNTPADYCWSSAAYYKHADLQWPFLTHFWYGEDWPPPLEYR